MADFWQSPHVCTIHNLRLPTVSTVAERVLTRVVETPVGIVIPAHVRDLSGPALAAVIDEIVQSGISANSVIVLNGVTEPADFDEIRGEISRFPGVHVLWVESPELEGLHKHIGEIYGVRENGGKGFACWLGLGYLLSCTESAYIVFQDADVETYTAEMTGRLVLPLLTSGGGLEIAKGYYARAGARMYGRLTRQFLAPLTHAFREMFPGSAFISLVSHLRYPLAGEVAISREFGKVWRVASGWSIEVGMLAEVQRLGFSRSLCQVEIADQYEHRHHPVTAQDSRLQTLESMAVEVGVDLLSILAEEGNVVTSWHQGAVLDRFAKFSEVFHRHYAQDAAANGLEWCEEEEMSSRRTFQRSATEAIVRFRRNATPRQRLPSWRSVLQSMPECEYRLRAACSLPGAARCAA